MYRHLSSFFHLDQKREYLLLKGLQIDFLSNKSWTEIILLLLCYLCGDLQRFIFFKIVLIVLGSYGFYVNLAVFFKEPIGKRTNNGCQLHNQT